MYSHETLYLSVCRFGSVCMLFLALFWNETAEGIAVPFRLYPHSVEMKMSTISIDRYIIQRAVVYYAENAKCSFISLYKNIHSQSGEMVGSSAERERTHTHTRKCRVARNETHATDIKIFFSWMQFGWFSEFGHGVYVSLIECAAFLSSLMCYFPYFSIISIHIKLIENVRFVRIISFHWYLHNFIRSLSISLCKWCSFSLSQALKFPCEMAIYCETR